jgi:hypothetical protein
MTIDTGLGLQLFDDDFADRFAFDILDPTKIIPEEEVPVRRVGRLGLDQMPENFFADTEQAARARTRRRASVPTPTAAATGRARSGGCGRRASPTITARRGSPSSAKTRSSGST